MDNYFLNKKVLVTGGCGFIGSHFVDKLMKLDVHKIIIIDDLSAGTNTDYIKIYEDKVDFYQENILNQAKIDEIIKINNIDIIIHLAAQPSVPISVEKPMFDFNINVVGTLNLLEAARKNNVKEFIFAASGGTVYGEPELFPTPENYPLYPISNYGAAKAAVEMYLSSYSHLYNMKCTSLRFGNVFGERSTHGVMYDFYHKLQENQKQLIILGDGKQKKSYLFISDCIDGFIVAATRFGDGFEAFNLASDSPVDVTTIANLMTNELGLDPEFIYTGGSRGWKGDVTFGSIDSSKLISKGWHVEISIVEGIKRYINWLKKRRDY